MLLLHHEESELSRTLLAALPDGATSLDCSQGLPEDYTGPQPSAYPSVVVDVPAYMADVPSLDADGGLLGMTTQAVAAHQEALRMPATWAAVDEYVAYVTARAAQSPVVES
jgi:hypothetical protein